MPGWPRKEFRLTGTYLLIAESHLTSRIPADIHATEKHALLPLQDGRVRWIVSGWGGMVIVMKMVVVALMVEMVMQLTLGDASAQLWLDRVVILLIDYIVHRIAVNQKILLEFEKEEYLGIILNIIQWLVEMVVYLLTHIFLANNDGVH